ncbi:hypothetical protein Tco_0104186 [Tanacetum coccineum]
MVEKNKLDEDLQGTPIDATLYRGMIGSLMYLTSSRPDLIYAVCLCDRYQSKPTEKHLNAVKRIFRYLKGTINMGLWYSKDTGSAQFLGDKLVSWSSKKQKSTAISNIEAKYIALSGCYAQLLWMRSQLTDYGFQFNKIPLYEKHVSGNAKTSDRGRGRGRVKVVSRASLSRTMNPTAVEQIALDNALVAPEARLIIGKCNSRIAFSKPQREATHQVTLDALKLSPCYPSFLITAEVPEIYMHQFWNSVNKIFPKLTDQPFDIPPFTDEEIMSFIYELRYARNIKTLPELVIDHMHKPWRTFAAVINRCIFGKTTGLDKLRLSRAQILWEMYYCKNVDFVKLLWEDFVFQIDNHYSKESMPYTRFIRSSSITLSHKTSTLKYVPKTEEHHVYGVAIPKVMINEDILNSTAYKTYYAYASGAKEPKKARKFKKPASLKLKTVPISPKEPTKKSAKKTVPAKKSSKSLPGVIIKDTLGVSVSKKKASAKGKRSKGIEILSDVALSEAALLKEATKRNDNEDDDNDDDSDDVSKGDDDKVDNDDDGNDAHDSERNDSDDDENPSFTLKDYEEEEHDEEYDVDVKSLREEHEKEGKGDAEMTDAD